MILSDYNTLFANKKEFNPVWQLRVLVEPMLSIDYVLCSNEMYPMFAEKISAAELLTFEVLYDGVTLRKLNFPDNKKQEVTIKINDTIEFKQHLLEFKMSGKENIHSCFSDKGESVSWTLQYCFFIEDLPMNILCYHTMPDSINNITNAVGQNQTEYIALETPIYSWLIKHSDYIVRDLSLDTH